MCVAAIAWDAHPDWLLVCAGNRDEYHAREAVALAPWNDGSGIIAGRDLRGGGTWLGATEAGRFALVTNFRVPQGPQPGRPSRGRLVTDLLAGIEPTDIGDMNPFNLILVDRGQAWFVTNHPQPERRLLAPGIHGLSNGGFDVPWPKTVRVRQALSDWFGQPDDTFGSVLASLREELPAPGAVSAGPVSAGNGPEPRFAPVFIRDPIYGTRCSTVLAIGRDGRGSVVERSYDGNGAITGETRLPFHWPLAALSP